MWDAFIKHFSLLVTVTTLVGRVVTFFLQRGEGHCPAEKSGESVRTGRQKGVLRHTSCLVF